MNIGYHPAGARTITVEASGGLSYLQKEKVVYLEEI